MKQLIAFTLLLLSISAPAQNLGAGNNVFSFTFGGANLKVQRYAAGNDLDFLNYMDAESDYFFDYETVKIGYKFKIDAKTTMDIRLLVMSDLLPENFDIVVYRQMGKQFHLGAGTMLTKNYISNFERFVSGKQTNYYLVDENEKQWKHYDLGFYLTPVYSPILSEKFFATIQFNVGLASFMRKTDFFPLKKMLSNERQIHHYATKLAFQPYINPKIVAGLNLFKVSNASVGVMAGASFFHAKRRINYRRTIQIWTAGNEVSEVVKTSRHSFSRLEMDFGLFVKW